MSVKLMEVDVNTTVATQQDHLTVFVNKASGSLVTDFTATVAISLQTTIINYYCHLIIHLAEDFLS